MSLLDAQLATPSNTFSMGKAYLTQQNLSPDLHFTTVIYLNKSRTVTEQIGLWTEEIQQVLTQLQPAKDDSSMGGR